jgi:hypothetical protein
VSLSQCLAGCTANVDCTGVSYDVCDNFTFCSVVILPLAPHVAADQLHKNASSWTVLGRHMIDVIDFLIMANDSVNGEGANGS